MPHLTTQILVSLLIPLLTRSTPLETSQYLSMRDDLIAEDEHMRLGGHLVLSVQEQRMNEIFMKEKRAMIQTSRTNRSVFVPSTSFYHSRRLIEETPLFEKIHQMPKGAALHIHDMSMVSLDWLVTNVTYRDDVYMCPLANGYLNFQVFNSSYQTSDCLWKLVKNERAASGNVTAFDLNLKNNLTLMGSDPFLTFADNQAAWVRFGLFFRQVSNLLYHVPIYRDMLWQTLREFRDANVQYLEIRGSFDQMFGLDGTRYDTEFGVLLVKQVADQFVKTYPDFSGVKVILSGIRNRNSSVILEEVKTAMELHKKYPEVVAGYDMSGNEALYNPLSYYSEALLYPSRQDPPYKLPYFLHAGETPWQGTETGFNIADAILLNATRIGHGYALGKHPKFLQKVKEQNIAVEVQPISNQASQQYKISATSYMLNFI
ncbi:adenosine deaminase AGSA-like [Physella acuta]|uniref:adenosine deaminase AGSA-like n=1 Tax=Physella acuta TaxID=109671 RepID=UPI0027DAED00|nr:adenosine deaminase AGSA-like [Physella acuta]